MHRLFRRCLHHDTHGERHIGHEYYDMQASIGGGTTTQTEKSSPKFFQALAVVLLITTILGVGATAYYYNQVTTENAKANDFATENARLKSQIDSLTSQVSVQNGQISDLRSQLVSLQSQFNAFRATVINVTQLSGFVKTRSGTPVAIIFYSTSPTHATVSSAVFNDFSYQVLLDNGVTYTLLVEYAITNNFAGIGDGLFTCTPTPSSFATPSGPSTIVSMSFFC